MLEWYLIKKNDDWKGQGKKAKDILQEGFKHNDPKIMFLLLPLFALILKNHKLYVEHIIYAIYLHCYLFLFLKVTILIGLILPNSLSGIVDVINAVITFTIIWCIYRSLRVVYNRNRWRTVSKMVGLSIIYTFVFKLSFFIILIITAVTTV
ncbi:hypothetical protein NAF17_04995 [Mucilaginibacter sp. RB4R14]|uniref:hypothetical protein n=1 Tax=Mucilaginibacter aurantiaciroseus TaxID=2949308 RepID=UPI002090F71D|nr:hypothetical protein [Mucilaginibacter aurantiaciroseus]MCO5934888.1 hypothetical protein [Mucilaginibacter aurantiaciroseus]